MRGLRAFWGREVVQKPFCSGVLIGTAPRAASLGLTARYVSERGQVSSERRNGVRSDNGNGNAGGGSAERAAVVRSATAVLAEARTLPDGEVRTLLEELSATLRRLAVVRGVPDDRPAFSAGQPRL
jgi:hypothetical protein